MTPRQRKTTTQRGLGHAHQQIRKRLLAKHRDGSDCWWCGEPMFKDPAANFDGHPLAADHDVARVNGGIKASRLLHLTCNSQRGDGSHDDRRPTLTGRPFTTDDQDDRSQWTLLDWGL